MAQLDSKDSSRNLHANSAIDFLFCPHLMLHTCVQTFNDIFDKKLTWNWMSRQLKGYRSRLGLHNFFLGKHRRGLDRGTP